MVQSSKAKKVVALVTVAQGVAQTIDDIENYAQYNGYDVRYTQKTSAEQAKSLALFMVDKVKRHILEQQLVMEKFLCHPLVKGFLPPYLEDNAFLRQSQGVLGNLKDRLIFPLVGLCQSKLVMAKDIVCTLATSANIIESGINSGRGIARLLGVDKRNIKRGMERQILLDIQKDVFWLTQRRTR
jgi:hypothetical protein